MSYKERLFRNKLSILYLELRMMQNTMDKYDGLIFQIRGWEISIWSALMVIALEFGRPQILLLAILTPFVFWAFDGMYKTYRENYKKRRDEIASFLNSDDFSKSFKLETINFKTPAFPIHSQRNMTRLMLKPHIFALHITLSLISAVAFVLIAL